MPFDPACAEEDYCYLTTTGRISGLPREIEIWFGLLDGVLYMLSGGRDRSDWVKNLITDPAVTVRIGDERHAGRGRVVTDTDEDERAHAFVVRRGERAVHRTEIMTDVRHARRIEVRLRQQHVERATQVLHLLNRSRVVLLAFSFLEVLRV